MADVQRTYLPAAGHDWTLPFYDPIVKLLGGDAARRALVDQADLQAGHRVLEVGCGTGTLLMLIKKSHPRVDVSGLDPDPKALARAKRKADAAGVSIQLDRGFSDALPYPDGSFDRVFSCFMFHHLQDAAEKLRTLREIRRVLRPGGRLQLLDFTRPQSGTGDGIAPWLHSSHRLEDNSEDRLLSFMSDAALTDPTIRGRRRMLHVLHTTYFQASC